MIISAFTPDNAKKNERLKEEYRRALYSYNIDRQKYFDNSNNYLEYTKIERSKNVRKALEQTAKVEHENLGVLKGKSEQYFYSCLQDVFPEKIFSDKVAEIFYSGNTYQPDLIYWDSDKKIAIDIEIDEPYELYTRKPIHCIKNGSEPDAMRDKYFLERLNWIVIRFTEEQVVKYPNDCIAVVSDVINKINEVLPVLINLPSAFLRSRWNEEDAIKMSKCGFREAYLNLIGRTSESEIGIENHTIIEQKEQGYRANNETEESKYLKSETNKLKSNSSRMLYSPFIPLSENEAFLLYNESLKEYIKCPTEYLGKKGEAKIIGFCRRNLFHTDDYFLYTKLEYNGKRNIIIPFSKNHCENLTTEWESVQDNSSVNGWIIREIGWLTSSEDS